MIKTVLISILLVSVCYSGSQESFTNDHSSRERKFIIDTIEYSMTGFDSSASLKLLSNNTFSYSAGSFSCFGSGNIKEFYGTYEQTSTKITLSPKYAKTFYYKRLSKANDSLNKPKQIVEEFPYADSETKIKTEYHIIRINNKSYALSEEKKSSIHLAEFPFNDFEILASNIKRGKPYRARVLSRQTTDTTLFTIEQIPTKWRFLFK